MSTADYRRSTPELIRRAVWWHRHGRSILWIARTLHKSRETVSKWLGRPARFVPFDEWPQNRRKRLRVEQVTLRVLHKLPRVTTWAEFDRLVGPGISEKFTRRALGVDGARAVTGVFRARRAERVKLQAIFALQKLARELGRTPTGIEFKLSGYPESQLVTLFGGIRKAQIAAGLPPHQPGDWRPRYRRDGTASLATRDDA